MTTNRDHDAPMGGYTALTSVFLAGAGAALTALDRKKKLPERIAPSDLALLGVATYSLSRTLTRDRVTAFLREPFAKVQGPAGRGEVKSEPQGSGFRKAVGELIICPFCIGQWVATAGLVGLCVAPRPTRFVASVFVVRAVAESVNLAHEAATAEIDKAEASKKIVQEAVAA
jgi:hypothetical protein